jgi:hypothetical protein
VKRILSLLLIALLSIYCPLAASAYTTQQSNNSVNATASAPRDIATFRASSAFFTPAASATDIFTINGSATTTVRILRIEIAYTASTLAGTNFFIIKRSTVNSGGTATVLTPVPLDINPSPTNPYVATSSVLNYTANPAGLGTTVGQIQAAFLTPDGVATVPVSDSGTKIIYDGQLQGAAITLRGVASNIAVNLAGATLGGTSGQIAVTVTFTEE